MLLPAYAEHTCFFNSHQMSAPMGEVEVQCIMGNGHMGTLRLPVDRQTRLKTLNINTHTHKYENVQNCLNTQAVCLKKKVKSLRESAVSRMIRICYFVSEKRLNFLNISTHQVLHRTHLFCPISSFLIKSFCS